MQLKVRVLTRVFLAIVQNRGTVMVRVMMPTSISVMNGAPALLTVQNLWNRMQNSANGRRFSTNMSTTKLASEVRLGAVVLQLNSRMVKLGVIITRTDVIGMTSVVIKCTVFVMLVFIRPRWLLRVMWSRVGSRVAMTDIATMSRGSTNIRRVPRQAASLVVMRFLLVVPMPVRAVNCATMMHLVRPIMIRVRA